MEGSIYTADEAKSLPHHAESEQAILGRMLHSSAEALIALEMLKPDDFYVAENREMFSAMRSLYEAGQSIDHITLDAELRRRGKLEAIGGTDRIVFINNEGHFARHVRDYIEIVDQKSTLRKLIEAAGQITRECRDDNQPTNVILDHAEKLIYDITMRKGGQDFESIGEVLVRAYDKMILYYQNKGQIEGIPTGYRELDDTLTGFHSGEFIVVAGRPSMGKTSIGMNFIENAAIRAGKKAAIFSLEMPSDQLAIRMLCTEAQVDMQRVRRGQLQPEEWTRLANAMRLISNACISIDATAGITVSEMRSKARKLKIDGKLDVIMIDYLSLMAADGDFGSRQEFVSHISRSLKALAIELNVPVIALQQLSRAPAGRSNHRPVLSDIRESGSIEQDADVVMFIHREDYYDPDTEDKNIAEIIVAKQRNGPLNTVKLGWKGEYTWFFDRSFHPNEAVKQ